MERRKYDLAQMYVLDPAGSAGLDREIIPNPLCWEPDNPFIGPAWLLISELPWLSDFQLILRHYIKQIQDEEVNKLIQG